MLVTVCRYEQNPLMGVGEVVHKISPFILYTKTMTSPKNSCTTCSIPKSNRYAHFHVRLVTVYGYEQTPSSGLGEDAHTRISPNILYSKLYVVGA